MYINNCLIIKRYYNFYICNLLFKVHYNNIYIYVYIYICMCVCKDFPKERYCTPYLSIVPRNVNLK